jgi:His-Xaa-Ser system radical SAM maturase HxsC
MCSQPPKKTHQDNFEHFEKAALLAPFGATLGFSGGEPTLYKQQLFSLLERVHDRRPDLRFHVLTNAQHFTEEDIAFLSSPAGHKVQWGVPIYAPDAELHDHIVGKAGAFEKLLDGLSVLCRSAAQVEVRTVLTSMNALILPALAQFITRFVPFASPWAIMQLERIGFAKNRWNELFFDNSASFSEIAKAIDIAKLSNVPVLLYNFPLCTVPSAYRELAPATISDWKNKYLPACDGCSLRSSCGGFFEWHSEQAYSRLERQ